MPTPPTFASGAVLTAAQMNTIGWHLVKTVTATGPTSSVNCQSTFTSDYENYRITFTADSGATTAEAILVQLCVGSTATTTNYKSFLNTPLDAWTSGAITNVTSTAGLIISYNHTGYQSGTIDILQPQAAKNTRSFGNYATNTNGGTTAGIQTGTTQFDGFNLRTVSTGTMSGVTVRIYGYRNSLT